CADPGIAALTGRHGFILAPMVPAVAHSGSAGATSIVVVIVARMPRYADENQGCKGAALDRPGDCETRPSAERTT
ncbi:MAG: hypothetical protein OEW42_20020, partial [Acidimicrobiia bacterium]|nr:hypothetical protein [Acidimicrobiia bacterium]